MHDRYQLVFTPIADVPREHWPVMWVQYDAYHAELRAVNDAYVPKVQGIVHYISDTMDVLRHPLTGEYISSKSKFRQITRERGGIEIGNESISKEMARVQATREAERKASLRETIQRQAQQYRRG